MDRDLIGYGATSAGPEVAGRRAPRGQLRAELRGRLGTVGAGRRSGVRMGADRDTACSNPGVPGRDLAAEGMFAYGSRVGFWRIMRLFAERQLPMTIFGCALALERNPPAAAAIRPPGIDVCCHGWRWEKHFRTVRDARSASASPRAVASLQQTMGERPLGWYCR